MKNIPQEESVVSTQDTIVGSGVKIKGDLASAGNIAVYGSVEGTLTAEGDIIVGDSSKVSASISAQNAEISGTVRGNILVKGLLKLTPTASVHGDISTEVLEIEQGANFSGKCSMNKQSEKVEPKTASN